MNGYERGRGGGSIEEKGDERKERHKWIEEKTKEKWKEIMKEEE